MAKLSIPMLAFAVVIATCLEMTWAQTSAPTITCYSCESAMDSSCNDPFKSSSIATCTGLQCYKSYETAGGYTVTTRGCYPAVTASNQCTTSSIAGVSGSICYCQGNNCNAATGIHSGHVTGALVLAAALAFIGRRLL